MDMVFDIMREYNLSPFFDLSPSEFNYKQNCVVYVFLFESGKIKIGRSKNVEKRKKTIECAIGDKVVKCWNTEGFLTKAASKLECMAHKEYAEYKVYGEYFNIGYEKAIDYLKGKTKEIKKIEGGYLDDLYCKWDNNEARKEKNRNILIDKLKNKVDSMDMGKVGIDYMFKDVINEIGEMTDALERNLGIKHDDALHTATDIIAIKYKIDLSNIYDMMGWGQEAIKTRSMVVKEIADSFFLGDIETTNRWLEANRDNIALLAIRKGTKMFPEVGLNKRKRDESHWVLIDTLDLSDAGKNGSCYYF